MTDNIFPIGRFSRDDVQRVLDDLNNEWTDYSQEISFTNLTVGNGTLVARYKRIGKHVEFLVSIVLGSTSSISGAVSFTLPVDALSPAGGLTDLGTCNMQDTGTGNFVGDCILGSTTTAIARRYTVSGSNIITSSISATTPFTWTTGDVLVCQGTYEAA